MIALHRVLLGEGVEIEQRSACMRNDDGTTDDEGDMHGILDLLLGEPEAYALLDVVADAIVAAEDGGGDEAEEFLGWGVEPAFGFGVFVCGGVESEESLDAEVVGVKEPLLSLGAFSAELVWGEVGHGEGYARGACAAAGCCVDGGAAIIWWERGRDPDA